MHVYIHVDTNSHNANAKNKQTEKHNAGKGAEGGEVGVIRN